MLSACKSRKISQVQKRARSVSKTTHCVNHIDASTILAAPSLPPSRSISSRSISGKSLRQRKHLTRSITQFGAITTPHADISSSVHCAQLQHSEGISMSSSFQPITQMESVTGKFPQHQSASIRKASRRSRPITSQPELSKTRQHPVRRVSAMASIISQFTGVTAIIASHQDTGNFDAHRSFQSLEMTASDHISHISHMSTTPRRISPQLASVSALRGVKTAKVLDTTHNAPSTLIKSRDSTPSTKSKTARTTATQRSGSRSTKNSAMSAAFRSTLKQLRIPLDREALSRGEHVEFLSFQQVLSKLTPYLWPEGDIATKVRLVSAISLLFLSKIMNVGVPVLFKEAIDGLAPRVPALQTPKSIADAAKAAGETNIEALTSTAIPSAKTADTTAGWVQKLTEMVTSAEFLHVATAQLPLAILLSWGIVRVLASFANEFKNALFVTIANTARTHFSVDLLKHLLNMDLAFHLDRNTGSISRAIDRGNSSISLALNLITFRLVPTAFEMALVLGVLATQCGIEYSAIAFATLLVYFSFTLTVTQWRMQFRQEMNRQSNNASSVAFDSLMNVDTVQKFNNQNIECDKYQRAWENYGHAQTKQETSLAVLNWGQFTIFTTGMTAVMMMAAQGVMDGQLSVGDLVMINALLAQLGVPLNMVGTVYRELKQAALDMQTMFALRQTKSQISNAPVPIDFSQRLLAARRAPLPVADSKDQVDHNDPIDTMATESSLSSDLGPEILVARVPKMHSAPTPLPEVMGFSLSLTDVTFSYPSNREKNIIDGVTVDIPAGKSVAFVGNSGCGKSTMLKLASRQFDPTIGSVHVDGVPIRDIELSSLRNTIGIVPQHTTLFNDTIMYNIRYAKPTATDEEVINAAKLAQIHENILSLKDGYNTMVGERGLKLSGGEIQRVSIARLMLINPPIIMCDEATSSLDSRTEFEIMSNLRVLTSNRTCLYIAHRLSTITHCDNIVVIQKGRIVEQGTHFDLLELPNGVYRHMWMLQSTVVPGTRLEGETKAGSSSDDKPTAVELKM